MKRAGKTEEPLASAAVLTRAVEILRDELLYQLRNTNDGDVSDRMHMALERVSALFDGAVLATKDTSR